MAGFKPAFPGTPPPPAKQDLPTPNRHPKPLDSLPTSNCHPEFREGSKTTRTEPCQLPRTTHLIDSAHSAHPACRSFTDAPPVPSFRQRPESRVAGGHPPPTTPNPARLIRPLAIQELVCYYPHMNISTNHNRAINLSTQASILPVPLSSHSALNLSSFRPTDASFPSSSQCLPARKQDTMNQFGTDFLRSPSHSLQTPSQRRRN